MARRLDVMLVIIDQDQDRPKWLGMGVSRNNHIPPHPRTNLTWYPAGISSFSPYIPLENLAYYKTFCSLLVVVFRSYTITFSSFLLTWFCQIMFVPPDVKLPHKSGELNQDTETRKKKERKREMEAIMTRRLWPRYCAPDSVDFGHFALHFYKTLYFRK